MRLPWAVGVLLISPNQRPHSLRCLLLPVFRRLAGGEGPLLLSLRKKGSQFSESTGPLPEAVDHGAAAIRTFLEQVEAGQVDLGAPVHPVKHPANRPVNPPVNP